MPVCDCDPARSKADRKSSKGTQKANPSCLVALRVATCANNMSGAVNHGAAGVPWIDGDAELVKRLTFDLHFGAHESPTDRVLKNQAIADARAADHRNFLTPTKCIPFRDIQRLGLRLHLQNGEVTATIFVQ